MGAEGENGLVFSLEKVLYMALSLSHVPPSHVWPQPNLGVSWDMTGHLGRHLNAPTTALNVSVGQTTQPPEKPAYFPAGHCRQHASHDHAWAKEP
jgi:hypothetical protein